MIDKNRLRSISLIVFDVDGTLVDQNDEIGQQTIQLVQELKNYDVKFSFASGRQHSALIKHAETLNITTPLVSLDGTLITSHPGKDKIFESTIPNKYVKKAIAMADKYFLKIALCHDEAIYYDEYNSGVAGLIEKYGARFEEVSSYDNYLNNTLEIVIAGDYKDTMKYVNKKMHFPYTWGLVTSFYKSHSHGGFYYLEIRKKGASKGKGLRKLSKYLDVSLKNTAVLGDWYNDLSLFETDALKIAVGNAVPELKRKADYVTSQSTSDNNVAEFLAMVLKAKQNR